MHSFTFSIRSPVLYIDDFPAARSPILDGGANSSGAAFSFSWSNNHFGLMKRPHYVNNVCWFHCCWLFALLSPPFSTLSPGFFFFFQIENSCTYVRLCVCVSVCVTQNIQTSAHTHKLNTLSSNLECFKFEWNGFESFTLTNVHVTPLVECVCVRAFLR